MSPDDLLLAAAIGFVSGVLAGMFGVGGGIIMTPGIQVGLGAAPIVSLATPLPVILPTAFTGALTYRRAGEVDMRAAMWIVIAGVPGAVMGALLTEVIRTHLLLVVTAGLLAFQAIHMIRGDRRVEQTTRLISSGTLVAVGFAAGFVSGLLGIGGGLVIVPLLAHRLGMPLKRALGTSLLAIVVLVIPGTIVHTALGHIEWGIFFALTLGAVPGAWVGAQIALGTREVLLRRMVGSFLLVVAVWYGVRELQELLGA